MLHSYNIGNLSQLLRNSSAVRSIVNLRRFSFDATESEVLKRWMGGWVATPPCIGPALSDNAPTALTWTRRGLVPPLTAAALHRLFRQREVRVWDPLTDGVRRVGKDVVLPRGSRVLVPKAVVLSHQHLERRSDRDAECGTILQLTIKSPAMTNRILSLSPAQEGLKSRIIQNIQSSVLCEAESYMAINKPAGLAVQGGSGIVFSLDALLPLAFPTSTTGDHEKQLKLVHRLDKAATGVLLLAKGADAAGWLGVAFRRPAESLAAAAAAAPRADAPSTPHRSPDGDKRNRYSPSTPPAARSPTSEDTGLRIEKKYWAVVCPKIPFPLLPKKGVIRAALSPSTLGEKENSDKNNNNTSDKNKNSNVCVSRFKVVMERGALALVELEPVTGRKHQLRIHCATHLGAPILGDTRYGCLRTEPQRSIIEEMERATASGGDDTANSWTGGDDCSPHTGKEWPPLMLHCRELVIREPGRTAVKITAPLPSAWVNLFKSQQWRLPT